MNPSIPFIATISDLQEVRNVLMSLLLLRAEAASKIKELSPLKDILGKILRKAVPKSL